MNRRKLFCAAPAALLLAHGAADAMQPAVPHPDAELLQLGADLRRADTALDALSDARGNEDLEAADLDPCYRLCERIGRATACTLAGLRVKAMAFAWRNGAGLDAVDPDVFGHAQDEVILAGLVRDLLALPEGRAG